MATLWRAILLAFAVALWTQAQDGASPPADAATQETAAPDQAPPATPAQDPAPPESPAQEPTPERTPEPAPGEAKPVSTLGIAGIVGFVVALIGGLLYFIYAMEQAWFKTGRKVAGELGSPHPPIRNKTITEDYEVHRWQYEDVPMLLQVGSRIVAAPGSPTGAIPITAATVTAQLPKKLDFRLEIGKPGSVEGPRFLTGDATFDEELCCVASLDEAARRLLADAPLREAIRELLQSDASLPTVQGTIRGTEVEVRVFDRKRVREYCVKAAAVARALSRKAQRIAPPGPAAQTLGAAAPVAASAPFLPAADPARPVLGLSAVLTTFPSWSVEGPVFFREEGVYFFFKTMEYQRGELGAGQLLGASAGLLGALVGAAIDKGLEQAPLRPGDLYYGSSGDISERLGSALAEASDILHRREFFVLPRAQVQKVELDGAGNLCLMTSSRTFTLHGEDMAKAKGFLAFRGYMGPQPPAVQTTTVAAEATVPPPAETAAAHTLGAAAPGLSTPAAPPPPKPVGTVQTAADWLDQARAHLARGDMAQARRCFAQAADRNPNLIEAWIGLGSCLAKAKQVEEATRAFDRALKVEPGHALASREKGRALLAGGLLGSALEALRDAAARDPSDAEASALLHACQARMGKARG